MTPERAWALVSALHRAGWRVDIRPKRGDRCTVVVRAPVTWEGESVTARGATVEEALGKAWQYAWETDPGVRREAP